MRLLHAIPLLSLAAVLAAADHVEIHLASGQVVTGEVVRQDDEQVVVKQAYVGKNGATSTVTLGYKRADIASITALKDPDADYRDRAKAAATAADHAALAAWCQQHAMADRAVEQAIEALALDPAEPTAPVLLAKLGRVQVDGAWVVEADWLAKQGKVRYRGTVMTVAEADALKQQEKDQAAQDARQKETGNLAAWIASTDQRLARLKARAAQIDKDLAAVATAIAADQAAVAKVAQAKTLYDSAQGTLDQLRAQNNANPMRQVDTTAETYATERAQKALIVARREGATASSDLATQQARQKALQDEKATNAKQTDDLTKQREKAVADLAKAQALAPADPTKSDAGSAAAPAAAHTTTVVPAPATP